MVTGYVIRKNEYHDSVFLMRVARRISEQRGVQQAAALMGTDKNKGLLAGIGIRGAEIDAAAPGDLILGVIAESREVLSAILGQVRMLQEAGAVVLPSSARAAQFSADLIQCPGGFHD